MELTSGSPSDIVSAISCTAHYLMKELTEFTPLWRDNYRPVPIMEIHGTSDEIVGYGYPLGLDSRGFSPGAERGYPLGAEDIVAINGTTLYEATRPFGLPWDIPTIPEAAQLSRVSPFGISGQWYKETGITAASNRELWASINGCTDYLSTLPLEAPRQGSTSTSLGGNSTVCYAPPNANAGETYSRFIRTSTDCKGGSEVALVSLIAGPHTPPAADVTVLMWNFMKRFPNNQELQWIPDNCE